MNEKKRIFVQGTEYPVTIHIEPRNSTRASITQRGVHIRVPIFLSRSRRELEITKLIHWVEQQITHQPPKKDPLRKYNHEDYIRTPSTTYQLDIQRRDSKKNFAKIYGTIIKFKIANNKTEPSIQEYLSKQTRKMLAKIHEQELQTHVNKINKEHFNQEIKKVSYRYTKSRWGVCKTTLREIEISTRLLLAPKPILEYVIIHEIAHFLEPNHSFRFWNIVKKVDHRYKEKINWLKQNGHTLIL